MTSAPVSPPLSRLLELAAQAVQAVREGRSLTDVLAASPTATRPGTRALASQVLRRLGAATALRQRLAQREPPPEVDALLVCALALLWPDPAPPYPDHTLVDQAVAAVRRRAPASAGFANAVLRRFIRERPALVEQVERKPAAAYNHPPWWIERLRQDWPADWERLLQAAQLRPPMTLRVNRRRSTAQGYVERLATEGLAARVLTHPLATHAVQLDQPCAVDRLPGFEQGDASVQDLSAQLAAPLLLGAGLPAGARVLDACAAPGGKTAHLLECADLDLLALDSDPTRLPRVREGLERLGPLQAARTGRVTLQAADARQPQAWWDGHPFDAILLDAPCSASGIVRRHPDIRWLRRPGDVDALARVQAELLDALWPLLKPGGRLLYATCSVFKAEGSRQIDAFLQRQGPDRARLDPKSPGHLLPLPENQRAAERRAPRTEPRDPSAREPVPGSTPVADGFFYALLHRSECP